MATNPIQSAGLRFLQKFGVAFLWASMVGALLGGLAYFRVDRRELERDPRWHVPVRLFLEGLEARTVDWRARQLGASDERPDGVVLINVDEDTLTNARESQHPEWAMRPWPRELVGKLAEQAIREGATAVFIEDSFADVSAHQCAPCRGEDPRTDDARFAELLKRLGGKVTIGFDWSPEPRRPADRPLMPTLVRVAEVDDEAAAFPWLQRVLAQRTTAYLEHDGAKHRVWAGSTGEARTKELVAALEVKGTPVTRSLTAADDELEVSAELLHFKLRHVRLSGFDPELALRAAALDAPVAPLLLPEIGSASNRLLPDPDGVVRSVPLFVNTPRIGDGQGLLPALPIRLRGGALSIENGQLKSPDQPLVPIDRQGFLTLRWNAEEAGRAGRGTMKRAVPAWRLLVNREDDDAGRGVRHHDNDLAGRVVVLVDERTSPIFDTPVGELNRGQIWAQALTNVARGQGIRRVEPEMDFWLTVAFAFAGAVLAVAWSSLVRRPGWLAWVATLGVVIVVHAVLARQLYVTQQRQVAMAAPILACAFTFLASLGYARTLEQSLREFMLRALGGAVRADVFRRVERDLALMRPERRELTVFFSDIEGFTSVSNRKDPQVVVEVLRQYLGEMTTLVLDHGGHVDKYLGDGLMAFWGAPVALPNDAEAACDAALRMHARFDEKRKDWEARCDHSLTLRAGLETGDAVVGEMGTLHRVNYTVMGEPVATAFRLEALAKRYGVRTLCGETLVEEAHEAFLFRPLDVVRMGREGEPLKIYELLAPIAAEGFEWVRDYTAAWETWRAAKFSEALAAFEALAKSRPTDPVIARYVARCRELSAAPPPAGWDGIYDGD
ncbi:MAG: CHASE2 domain-containing protein [Myxococcota bacterium]